MASLQIRRLPDDVYEVLLARARRERRSLAQQALVELRAMAEVGARERRLEVIEELRRELPRPGRRRRKIAAPEKIVRQDRER